MPKSFLDLANEARARIKEVDAAQTAAALASGEVVIVDVREPDEYAQGHIEGAVNVPRGVAEMGIPRVAPDPHARIICYCASGNRSVMVADSLRQMGYERIESLTGGLQAWVRSGKKVAR